MEFALRDMGLDNAAISAIHDMLEFIDDTPDKPQHPSRAFIRDNKAIKSTPADVIELPNAYNFVVDMPGLKPDQIRVHLEDDNVLVVSGQRRRLRNKEEGVKYLSMERRLGKLLKKFVLPENADKERVSAVCEDGVLTVVVDKSPPPQVKKPKVIEVKVGGGGGGGEGGKGVVETKASDWHESTQGSQGEAEENGSKNV